MLSEIFFSLVWLLGIVLISAIIIIVVNSVLKELFKNK